jgi:peptidoglycan hydrolase-like amidase
MSQTGSRDKAEAGWSSSRILTYYYKGIVLDS